MGQRLTNPVQTYFIPLPEEALINSFKSISDTAIGPVVNLISIAVAAEGTVVHYDHHEDEVDTEFLADVSQKQSSTEIWGDGDCSNGGAPGIASTRDAETGATLSCDPNLDFLKGGDVIILMSSVPVGADRDNTIFYFDGRDRVLATLPIAITRSAYPQTPGSLLAGAVEVFNRDEWGMTFVAPVGNNTLGNTDPFSKYCAVNIQPCFYIPVPIVYRYTHIMYSCSPFPLFFHNEQASLFSTLWPGLTIPELPCLMVEVRSFLILVIISLFQSWKAICSLLIVLSRSTFLQEIRIRTLSSVGFHKSTSTNGPTNTCPLLQRAIPRLPSGSTTLQIPLSLSTSREETF
jgi:hypothetical protein